MTLEGKKPEDNFKNTTFPFKVSLLSLTLRRPAGSPSFQISRKKLVKPNFIQQPNDCKSDAAGFRLAVRRCANLGPTHREPHDPVAMTCASFFW